MPCDSTYRYNCVGENITYSLSVFWNGFIPYIFCGKKDIPVYKNDWEKNQTWDIPKKNTVDVL
jgi:hypothetical protein